MPIKDATKDDISAMTKRIRDAQADLQIDVAIKMVNKHRAKTKDDPREEVFNFA